MKTNANVLHGTQWAATPNSENGTGKTLQQSTHSPSVLLRLKRILPHREDIVMADGRQIKGGIIIHPIIATALLGAVIAIGGAIYRSNSAELAWQHDQLVILATQKADEEKRAAEKAEEMSKRLQNIEATQIALGRDLVRAQEMQKAKRN